jgi:transcriptional regulator with XRE-family HTH domain
MPIQPERASRREETSTMQASLTPTAAKELGRSLRFVRHARNLTLRDIARSASLSPQYVQNIERGERGTVSEDAYIRFAKALAIPEEIVLDLLMRARIQSALERRGLQPDQVVFVWRGVEQRLAEQGIDLRTDIAKVVVDILG